LRKRDHIVGRRGQRSLPGGEVLQRGQRLRRRGGQLLGKTFKGMTDAMLDWQTTRFTELAVGAAEPAASDRGPTDSDVVKLRPEQVVEIAFDGVQGSTRYPGGMALRFARVLRYRDDKSPAEADTIDTVRARYERNA
jgi:DNA ligase-1